MTGTPIPAAPTFSQMQQRLFATLGERQKELQREITARQEGISRLRREQLQAAEFMDGKRAQDAYQAIVVHQTAIAAAYRQFNLIKDEIELVGQGNHPQVGPLAAAEAAQARDVAEAEYLSATDAFQAMLTPELRAAAKRLAHATRSRGLGWEPSSTVKALIGEI